MKRGRGTVGKRKDRAGLWLRWTDHTGRLRKKRAASDKPAAAERELAELLLNEDALAEQAAQTEAAEQAHQEARPVPTLREVLRSAGYAER